MNHLCPLQGGEEGLLPTPTLLLPGTTSCLPPAPALLRAAGPGLPGAPVWRGLQLHTVQQLRPFFLPNAALHQRSSTHVKRVLLTRGRLERKKRTVSLWRFHCVNFTGVFYLLFTGSVVAMWIYQLMSPPTPSTCGAKKTRLHLFWYLYFVCSLVCRIKDSYHQSIQTLTLFYQLFLLFITAGSNLLTTRFVQKEEVWFCCLV